MADYRNSIGALPGRDSPYFMPRPRLFSPEVASQFSKNPNEIVPGGRREQVLAHSPIRSSNQSNSSQHTSFSFPTSMESAPVPQPRPLAAEKSPQVVSAVPKDIQSGLQRIKETQMGMLSELRASDPTRTQIRPYSKISEESIGNFESSKQSREEEATTQKRRLEAELTSKMKRIEELLYSERELQKAVHDLKAELDSRKSERSLEQVPNTTEGPLLDRYHQDVIFYKAESQKLMAENVRLKKELIMRQTDSIDKGSKSQQNFPEVCSFSLNQRSVRADNINASTQYVNLLKAFDESSLTVQRELKKILEGGKVNTAEREQLFKVLQKYEDSRNKILAHIKQEVSAETTIDVLARSKQNLELLNKLKQKLIEAIRRNNANYDFLQVEAEYQTTYFRITSELENFKHKVALDAKQQKKEPQKQNLWELKQSNQHLTNEVISLKKYIQSENLSKAKFLQQLDKSNSVNKSVFIENQELKREMQLLRRRSIGRQDSFKVLNNLPRESIKEDLKKENSELQKQILQLSNKLQQAVRITSRGSLEILEKQSKDKDEMIIKLRQESDHLRMQINSSRLQLEGTKSNMKQLQSTINNLSRDIEEKERYASELEASLAPIKPKKPFILNKSIDDKEQELKEKVVQLTTQATRMSKQISQLEEQLEQAGGRQRELRQNLQGKQVLFKQRITQLQNRVADLQSEVNNDKLVHDTSIKKYQLRIQQLESASTNMDQFRRQHSSNYQREMSKLLTLTGDNETRIRQEYTQQIAQIQNRYDQERNQYMTIIRQLADQKQRTEEEFQSREKELLAKQVTNEKDISRLAAENEALKRSVEAQIEKLSRINSEHSKTLIEKYEKDVLNLTKSNQLLMSENKAIPGLQMQLNNQLTLIRQLQANVKDRTLVVDHLWQIKRVEYDNMLRQLKKLQSFSRS